MGTSNYTTMKIAHIIALTVQIVSAATQFISPEEAKLTIHTRERRANDFFEEKIKPSSRERECVEELCDKEEYIEMSENYNDGDRENFNFDVESFETYYTECMKDVNSNGLNKPAHVDLRGACIVAFEKKNEQQFAVWPNKDNGY